MVSRIYGREYTDRMEIYRGLGVLYYVIYNPEFWQRDGHQPFEVYKLSQGNYALQSNEPYWMEEVGLGIGRCQVAIGKEIEEQLAWFDRLANRYLTDHELLESERLLREQERQQKECEHQGKERLAQYLRSIGIDPDQLPD